MKAVLVIDMPNECIKCPLFVFGVCQANRHTVSFETITFGKKSNYCPLRPLPEKLVPFGYLDVGNEDGLYEKGWNACIKAITGETE